MVSLVGCDSSTVFDDCIDDPAAAPGSRRMSCRSSVFNAEDLRAREVVGVVRRGEDLVPGAIVRVDPSPGFAGASSAAAVSTITDAAGFFGGLRPIALRYDLSTRLGDDFLYYRGLAGRYVEPSLEGPRTFARAYSARVDLRLDRAIPEGHSVAFFASGDGVLSVSGDLATGLSVLQRKYTTTTTIHVLEYETSGGFEKATAYAKADLVLDAGLPRIASASLQPIPFFVEPKLVVSAPPGLAPSAVEIRFGFTRTSDGILTTVPVGATPKIPIIPNAAYTYRARATLDGAVSDTGEIGFDVLLPETEVELPELPSAASPLEGEARGPGETLLVGGGEGVFEHVIEPEGGGRTMRIITRQRETTLPDVTVLGGALAAGPYTWTIRSYPTARFTEELSGLDSRRYRPMGVAKPRSIVLR